MFLVLVTKINSVKVLWCHTFICVHVGHFVKIIFCKSLILGKLRKFSTSKITEGHNIKQNKLDMRLLQFDSFFSHFCLHTNTLAAHTSNINWRISYINLWMLLWCHYHIFIIFIYQFIIQPALALLWKEELWM